MLTKFIDSSGDLGRGIGFFARCLMSWPESTQGTRFYKPGPATQPHVGAFNSVLRSLLGKGLRFDGDGNINPVLLQPTEEALAVWK